jgi:carbon monoxide dehydrogenase subunit G
MGIEAMRLEYSHSLQYSREKIWETLLDPQVLRRVLPGVETFDVVGAGQYEMVVALGVPAVKGTFRGSIAIEDEQFPSQYRLRGQGKGAPGWVRGSALIEFVPESDATRVALGADVQVGGRIAVVGQRALESVAKAMVRELFESLDRELAGRQAQPGRFVFLVRMVGAWIRALFGSREKMQSRSQT